MNTMRECGPTAWLDVLVMIIALMVAVVAIVVVATFNSKAFALGISLSAVGLAVAVRGVGVVGSIREQHNADEVLKSPGLDPSQVARIRAEGKAEALGCTTIGLVLMGFPFLLSVGATVGALQRKQD